MSLLGVIERPLLPDEFSIYFASQGPIPLAKMATFLRKLDTVCEELLSETGFYLELSEYASGSGEPRFRVVQRERASLREAVELQRRAVEAAERQAACSESQAAAAAQQLKWIKTTFFGSVLVVPVAGAIATSMVSGSLNPSTKSLVSESSVREVVVRAPDAVCESIAAKTILEARPGRKTDRKGQMAAMELGRLSHALRAGDTLRLAGRGVGTEGKAVFRTLNGNRLNLVDTPLTRSLIATREAVVIEAIVSRGGGSWFIKPEVVITPINDV
jgi:hypothetical protein